MNLYKFICGNLNKQILEKLHHKDIYITQLK